MADEDKLISSGHSQDSAKIVTRSPKISKNPSCRAASFTSPPLIILKIPGSIIAVSGIWCFKTPISPSVSQPFHVAEQFTGLPGRYVPVQDTIQGFKEILEGKHDDIPESYFLNAGSIGSCCRP